MFVLIVRLSSTQAGFQSLCQGQQFADCLSATPVPGWHGEADCLLPSTLSQGRSPSGSSWASFLIRIGTCRMTIDCPDGNRHCRSSSGEQLCTLAQEPGFDPGRLLKTNSSDYHYQGRLADVTIPTLTALPTGHRLEGRASGHTSQSSCPEVAGSLLIIVRPPRSADRRRESRVSKAGVSLVSRAGQGSSQSAALTASSTNSQQLSAVMDTLGWIPWDE